MPRLDTPHRLLRFRLRTLLFAITVACAGLAWAHSAHRQQQSVDALLDSNPSVNVFYGNARESSSSSWQSWSNWLGRKLGQDYVASVTTVELMYPTDNDLECLGRLPSVRTVRMVRAVDLTNTGLKRLASLPRLESLSIAEAEQIDDAGLVTLAQLPHLKRLKLGIGNRVTPAGIERLKAAGLEHLTLFAGDEQIWPPSAQVH